MSYFDVYKSRINALGENYKSRVMTIKGQEFDNFLSNSVYTKNLRLETGATEIVSLQPDKEKENQNTAYLLTDKELLFDCGEIVTLEEEDYPTSEWLILSFNPQRKDGYNRFMVIEAKNDICWEKDGVKHCGKGSLTGGLDKALLDLFKIVDDINVYREPGQELSLIMPSVEGFEKEQYLEYGGHGWKVATLDDFTVPGVTYARLTKSLKREPAETHYSSPEVFW